MQDSVKFKTGFFFLLLQYFKWSTSLKLACETMQAPSSKKQNCFFWIILQGFWINATNAEVNLLCLHGEFYFLCDSKNLVKATFIHLTQVQHLVPSTFSMILFPCCLIGILLCLDIQWISIRKLKLLKITLIHCFGEHRKLSSLRRNHICQKNFKSYILKLV